MEGAPPPLLPSYELKGRDVAGAVEEDSRPRPGKGKRDSGERTDADEGMDGLQVNMKEEGLTCCQTEETGSLLCHNILARPLKTASIQIQWIFE